MPLPVTKSPNPRANPPLWMVTVVGSTLALLTDFSPVLKVIIIVAVLAAGVLTQTGTLAAWLPKPDQGDQADHADPAEFHDAP